MSGAEFRKRSLLLVEGHHDLEFVGKILRCRLSGAERIRNVEDLDAFWHLLTRLSFPQDGDLTKRMDVPGFFQNDHHAIGIVAANSVSALVGAGKRTLERLKMDNHTPDSIGFILDADKDENLNGRYENLINEVVNIPQYSFTQKDLSLGTVAKGNPRFGVFIMPDCGSKGTLEDLLLECAEENYPDLKGRAEEYVAAVDSAWLRTHGREDKELNKPAGRKKAAVSAIASVLKPSKSLQVSIHDNHWINDASLKRLRIRKLCEFLSDLLDEPALAGGRMRDEL